MPLRIVFMGTPDFAVPTLAEIVGAGHEVVAVYTQPPRPPAAAWRSANRRCTTFAERRHPRAARRTSFEERGRAAAFAAHRRRCRVVVAYGLILPPPVLDAPRLGCFNLHASLLPRWRGAAPIQRAIMAGDAETGVMVMRMEEGLDTGPVCLAERVAIGPDMTAGELHDVLARRGAA